MLSSQHRTQDVPHCVALALLLCLLASGLGFKLSPPTTSLVITEALPLLCVVLASQVTLFSKGGHSSMPPVDGSSIGDRLGRFLAALEGRPAPAKLVQPTTDFMGALARLAGREL